MNVASLNDARTRAARDMLFAPSADELARALPDAGESLLAAAIELSKAPQPDACDRFLAKLNGASQVVNRLRAALVRESQPLPPAA